MSDLRVSLLENHLAALTETTHQLFDLIVGSFPSSPYTPEMRSLLFRMDVLRQETRQSISSRHAPRGLFIKASDE